MSVAKFIIFPFIRNRIIEMNNYYQEKDIGFIGMGKFPIRDNIGYAFYIKNGTESKVRRKYKK